MNDELMEQLLRDGESACLDYKVQQYVFANGSDEEKSEVLKDILSFANRWGHPVAYILIGVEEVTGGRSIVHDVSEHPKDNDLQQFVNSKTNRPVTFSYTVFQFEGKAVGVIGIVEQDRPIFLLKNYGKLVKEVVYYRLGTSTAIASPDEIVRMAAPAEVKRIIAAQRSNDQKEQVRVKLGIEFSDGLYADVYNSGEIPVYIKQVALTLLKIDESKSPPFSESTVSVPLVVVIELPVADGRGSVVHTNFGQRKVDIPPRKQARFVLPKFPPAFLENFTKDPDRLALSIETFSGEIHRIPGSDFHQLLLQTIGIAKAQEEAAKPKVVNFYSGRAGDSARLGSVSVQRANNGAYEITVLDATDGFELSDADRRQLVQELVANRVIGRLGEYEWRID